MSMKSNIFFSILLLAAFIIPGITQAYSVTNSSATDLGNGKALFTVTYKFGFLNRELYMPIVTKRGADADNSTVAYELMANGKAVPTVGTMAGLVLSDVEIKNNEYYLPKGQSAEFTFIAVMNTDAATAPTDINLAITSLPFTMIDGKMKIGAEVAKTEIEAFKTPTITLKK